MCLIDEPSGHETPISSKNAFQFWPSPSSSLLDDEDDRREDEPKPPPIDFNSSDAESTRSTNASGTLYLRAINSAVDMSCGMTMTTWPLTMNL